MSSLDIARAWRSQIMSCLKFPEIIASGDEWIQLEASKEQTSYSEIGQKRKTYCSCAPIPALLPYDDGDRRYTQSFRRYGDD